MVKCNGRMARARGVSTDIVEASAKAYVNAVNALELQEAREAQNGAAPLSCEEKTTQP